jgi:hypothetical protein
LSEHPRRYSIVSDTGTRIIARQAIRTFVELRGGIHSILCIFMRGLFFRRGRGLLLLLSWPTPFAGQIRAFSVFGDTLKEGLVRSPIYRRDLCEPQAPPLGIKWPRTRGEMLGIEKKRIAKTYIGTRFLPATACSGSATRDDR